MPNKQVPLEETSRAKVTFEMYCRLGPGRSLAKLVEHLRQSDGKATVRLRTLEQWSSRFDWVERAAKIDAEIVKEATKQHRVKLQAMLDAMNEEQAEEARELRIKAKKVLHKLADNMINDAELNAPKLYGRDAVALYKESVSTQRLALGMATERTETEISGNPEAPLIIEAIWGTGSILEDNPDNLIDFPTTTIKEISS